MIGTFDLFGGFSDNTEEAVNLYQEFTSRIYSVLGLVIMFILAYQIILFVIDPDKGLKDSKKLVINVVKGIVLTILAPLIFHYMAQIQYHVLVSDNLIWNIVLGEGKDKKNDTVAEAGNSLTSTLYISMYHPVGTSYDSFFNDDGTLKSYEASCGADYTGGEISENAWANVIGVAGGIAAGVGIASLIAITGPIGVVVTAVSAGTGAIAGKNIANAIANLMSGEKKTVCQWYYYKLYLSGTPEDEIEDIDDVTDVANIEKPGNATLSYNNLAPAVAFDSLLSDHVAPEGDMEYYYFSPIAGAVILYFMFCYVLDIAYRAFKLAFLELVAPIPILLGTIPKNEKIYTQWKDSFIKTYLDIFVRVFVLSFIVLMFKLLPSFIKAMMVILTASFRVNGSAFPLRTLAFVFMVVGLLRFGQELPKMIADVAKNSAGLLSGIELNPKSSITKSKEALTNAGKPIGAVAGGAMGMLSARNAVKKAGGNRIDRSLAMLRGIQTGAKTGMSQGLSRGMLTNSMKQSNDIAKNDMREREDRWTALKSGNFKTVLDGLTQNRYGDFKSAFHGGTQGLQDRIFYQAGEAYQTTANGKGKYYSAAHDAADKKYQTVQDAMKSFTASLYNCVDENNNVISTGNTLEQVQTDVLESVKKTAVSDGKGGYKYSFNGKTYTDEDKLKEAINTSINAVGSATFRGKTYTGKTMAELEKTFKAERASLVRADEIDGFSEALDMNGIDAIQGIATSDLNVNNQFYDSIGKTLQDKLAKDASSKITDENGNILNVYKDFDTLLKSVNGNKTVNYGDVRNVMREISSDQFAENYERLSEEQRKNVNKGIAAYYRDLAEAEKTVSKNVEKYKGGEAGAEINRFTGRSENVLSSKPSKPDSKK